MIMKIFEALKLKKDLQERIQNLGNRYEENVRVKEGEKPLEDPNDVMKELEECLSQLYDLCCRINVRFVGLSLIDNITAHFFCDAHITKDKAIKRSIDSFSVFADKYSIGTTIDFDFFGKDSFGFHFYILSPRLVVRTASF